MKKILGVNISHHCSCAYFENNILKEYYEEDRFNKQKGFSPDETKKNNFSYEYQMFKKFENITFDVVVFSSYGRGHIQLEMPIIEKCLKQLNYKKYYFNINNHHIYHATCGYFFSKFNQAIALISDGGGEMSINSLSRVLQSIFLINEKEVIPKYKYFFNKKVNYSYNFVLDEIDYVMSNKSKAGLKYIEYLNKTYFKTGEEGQLMGIAAYKDKGTDLDKNILEIANNAQEKTLKDLVELIEKAKEYSDCKNLILSGGYHLNCLNNFKLVKLYPEYNFFVDPVPYDAGTAIGCVFYYENYL